MWLWNLRLGLPLLFGASARLHNVRVILDLPKKFLQRFVPEALNGFRRIWIFLPSNFPLVRGRAQLDENGIIGILWESKAVTDFMEVSEVSLANG